VNAWKIVRACDKKPHAVVVAVGGVEHDGDGGVHAVAIQVAFESEP
jgi:hypothetical protein